MTSRSGRWRMAALLLLLLPVELCLALYNPRWNNPDELSHAQYVLFLRDQGRLPDPYREPVKIQQDKHPPLTYALAALAMRATDAWFDRTRGEERWTLPGSYAVALTPHRFAEDLRMFDGQLYVMRLLMVAFALGTAACLLRIADLLLPGHPRVAMGLAAGLALVPQVALSGASLTPDTPLTFFSTLCWFHLLRIRIDESQALAREPWLCGLSLGLALLSKSAAVFLLPAVLLLLWRRFLWLIITLLLALLVGGWWYARNAWLYGDPFQMRAQEETFAVMTRFSPMGGPEWENLLGGLADSFFGFWHLEIQLAAPLLLLLQGLCVASLLGLCLLFHRNVREELPAPLRLAVLPSLLAAVTLLALVVLGNLRFPSPQGRYLYPALGPLLALLGAGILAVVRPGKDNRSWWVVPPAMAVLTLWSFFQLVVARETVERARAHGNGAVLYYEDCGNPAGHPHRTRGLDLPDQNQRGRRSASRTLDVDPEAVEYSFPIAAAGATLQVRVLYHNPDPSVPPRAEVEGRVPYSAQRLLAGGKPLHEHIDLTPTPRELCYPLPEDCIRDGQLTLRFERVAGTVAAVAEIWVEEQDRRASSPFLLRQAEALAERSGQVLGDARAEGGYRLTGPLAETTVCSLPLPAGTWLLRARVRGSRLVLRGGRAVPAEPFEVLTDAAPAVLLDGKPPPGTRESAPDDGFYWLEVPLAEGSTCAIIRPPTGHLLDVDWIGLWPAAR